MTQPSLSYQIARLEEELGETLFLRKPRSIELRKAGMLLLESAVLIVEEQARVVSKFRKREALVDGEVRYGIIPTVAPNLLPALLGSFRQEYPGVRLMVRESKTSQLLREVVAGDLEFAIVSDVESSLLKKFSLHLTPLYHERLLMAVPSAHPICGLSQVTPKAIDEKELIFLSGGNCLRDQTMKLCGAVDDQSFLVCEQLPTQLSMVGAGLGIAIVPEIAVRNALLKGVELVHFQEPAPTRMVGLLKKRGSKLGVAASEFVARLKKKAEEQWRVGE